MSHVKALSAVPMRSARTSTPRSELVLGPHWVIVIGMACFFAAIAFVIAWS